MTSRLQENQPIVERTDWIEVIILWLVGVFAAMQFAKFSISYDYVVTTYGVNSASAGVLLSVVGAVGLLFGVVAGVLSGHLGYRNVLIGSLCIGGGLSLFQSALPSYPLLLITRIIEGVSHLGLVVAAPTLMLRSCTYRSQSVVMGLWGTFFGVAFALTGAVGDNVLSQYGVSGLFLAHAIVSLPLISYFLISAKKNISSVSALSELSLKKLLASTLRVYLNPRTCLPGVVFLFHTCMFVALLTFIPRMSANEETKSLLLVALPLCSIVGTFCSGVLSQYIFRPPVLVFVAYLSVAFATFLVITLKDEQLFFIYSALFLLLASGVVQGASFVLIPAIAKTESERAMSNGAVAQLGNLGATVGPPIFAYFIDLNGDHGLLEIVVVLCLAGCITALISKKY